MMCNKVTGALKVFANERAAGSGVPVLCVSKDLPFALNRFCGAEGIDNVVSASAFRRLNAITEAGQFGDEGRNAVRGPGHGNIDLSLIRTFDLSERWKAQFRAECFNLLNHPNFGLPENDLQSPAFGQILQAGSPRLLQLAVKLMF